MSKGGGTRMVQTESRVPEKYQPFVDANLEIADALGNMPFIPYQGDVTAGLTQDQQRGFDLVRNAAGAQLGFGRGVAQDVAQTGVQDVMQQTTDEIMRANQLANRDLNSQAARAGAFGGARQALERSENTRNALQRAAMAASELGLKGQQLRLQAAEQMRRSGMSDFERDMGQARALMDIGGLQQGLDQLDADVAYSQFLEERNHPLRQLALRQSALGQTPLGTVQQMPVMRSGLNFGSLLGGLGGFASGLSGLLG